jgi:hypothetical protein
MNVSTHRKKHFEHSGNLLTVRQWTEMISLVNVRSVEPYDVTVMPKHFMHNMYVEY